MVRAKVPRVLPQRVLSQKEETCHQNHRGKRKLKRPAGCSVMTTVFWGISSFVIGVLVSINSQIIAAVFDSGEHASPSITDAALSTSVVSSAVKRGAKTVENHQSDPPKGSVQSDTAPKGSGIIQSQQPTNGTAKGPEPHLERMADALFNNIPVHYQESPIHSTVSCLGENFQPDAWKFRSCKYRNLCFDMEDKSFVIFRSKEQVRFEKLAVDQGNFTHSSSMSNLNVSIGGINPKWKERGQRLKWTPQVVDRELTGGHYEFDPNTVWVPYHSFAGYNVGHHVWDDYFPIFKLLSIFGFIESDSVLSYQLILSLFELKMWGTCDWNPKNTIACADIFPKFLPAMGLTNETGFSAVNRTSFVTADGSAPRSKYVCSPHGAAGIGTLTDHGFKLHGWNLEDYKSTHNVGRGKIFYDFRNFLLRNLGVPHEDKSLGPPYKVVFSKFSSKTKGRVKGFGRQIDILKKNFRKDYLQAESYRMSSLPLRQQAQLASEAAVFVSCVGGGAMTATFVPRGSSVILFYESVGGIRRNVQVEEPARLDWDVLNHASHTRVHWLPVETLDNEKDLEFFLELVKHELHLISHQEP